MHNQTARLGILGGMGPQATLALCQRVLDKTAADRDQDHIPTLIWSDTAIPDRTAAILDRETEGAYAALLAAAQLLEREGCTVLAMPCNTAHFFAPRLQAALGVPLLDMVQLAVSALKRRGVRRVGVLATQGTVRAGVYQAQCTAADLAYAAPDGEGQGLVTQVIYEEIKRGGIGRPGQLDVVLDQLRQRGCDGVVVGCTELSVYFGAHGLPPDCLDAMDVLAEECVRACGYPLR